MNVDLTTATTENTQVLDLNGLQPIVKAMTASFLLETHFDRTKTYNLLDDSSSPCGNVQFSNLVIEPSDFVQQDPFSTPSTGSLVTLKVPDTDAGEQA